MAGHARRVGLPPPRYPDIQSWYWDLPHRIDCYGELSMRQPGEETAGEIHGGNLRSDSDECQRDSLE